MSPLIAGAVAALIVGLPGSVIAFLTLRQNRASAAATNALESRKVGRDEFESVTRELRSLLEDERRLRRRAESRVTQLEQALHDANIPIPPTLADN